MAEQTKTSENLQLKPTAPNLLDGKSISSDSEIRQNFDKLKNDLKVESLDKIPEKEVVNISFSIGHPEGLRSENNKTGVDEALYKKVTYKDGTSNVEKVMENKLDNKDQNNSPTNTKENTLDLNADSASKKQPTILRPDFNIRDRIKKVGDKLDKNWKETAAYLALTKKMQTEIEKNNDLKKMYRFIGLDNVSGINEMFEAGHLTPEMINFNNSFALRLVVGNGSTDMAKKLLNAGGNAYAIEPKNCYSQEMADVIIQQRYKMDHPVMSTLREGFGLGMPKPRFV